MELVSIDGGRSEMELMHVIRSLFGSRQTRVVVDGL